MTLFNEGWWNCFLSYTDTICFSISAYDFAKEQMDAAGVKISEIDEVLRKEYPMSKATKDILIEYKVKRKE